MAQQGSEEKRNIMRYYDELAGAYDSLHGDEQNLKIELALRAVRLRDSDLILDVGCGTGLLLDHIGDSARQILGLDLSSGVLKVAAERSKKLRKGYSASVIRADADYMPFPKETFDKVFAFTLLQNLPDPYMTVREMTRVARTNSMIVITGLKRSFSEERIKDLLSGTGLEVSIKRTVDQAQDLIAVCHKVHNIKDK